MTPFLLHAPCKDYLWGGNRLREYGKRSDAERIAESWELSCHPDGESVIASGEAAGMTLTAFLAAHPEAAGIQGDFPVLVKLIDAKEDLSVQVHPDDAYALAHEGQQGKTEMWYIVDAAPGAALYYGFRQETDRETFRRAIENGTLLELLRRVPVSPGDVFFIPAGTLHAIGAGILLAEVQQNSNVTYRVFDYGRGRELHIDKALDVTTLTPATPFPPDAEQHLPNGCHVRGLAACDAFSAKLLRLTGTAEIGTDSSFLHLLMLSGQAELTSEGETLSLQKGSSVFVPAHTDFRLEGSGELLTVRANR